MVLADEKPHAVLFDVGDTLVAATPIAAHALRRTADWLAAKVPQLNREAFVASYERLDVATTGPAVNHLWGLPVSIMLDAGRSHGVSKDLGLAASGVYRAAVRSRISRCEELVHTFTALRRAGIAVGVVSNGTTTEQIDTLELLGVLDLCEVIAVSEQEGVEKPDDRLFHVALDSLGVEPSHVWFVGDDYEVDVVPAQRLGIRPVLVGAEGAPGVTRLESAGGVWRLAEATL